MTPTDNIVTFAAHRPKPEQKPRHRTMRLTEEQLQACAMAMGLYVVMDKFGNYYLTLPPDEIERRRKADEDKHPGRMSIDPYAVLYSVRLAKVLDYLDTHTGPHRFLGPADVIGAIRGR